MIDAEEAARAVEKFDADIAQLIRDQARAIDALLGIVRIWQEVSDLFSGRIRRARHDLGILLPFEKRRAKFQKI